MFYFSHGCMEKSQGTGIESCSTWRTITCTVPMHGKIPRNGNWKTRENPVVTATVPSMHGKIPRNGNWKQYCTSPFGFFSNSMHGKIPRNGNWKYWIDNIKLEDFQSDAWKNPKERELKEKCFSDCWNIISFWDAWKNPKERELKDNRYACSCSWHIARCMEKSQGTGIER